jgi:hypothetical protein
MPRTRSRKAVGNSAWEAYKELLRVLWLEQNGKLEQVMKIAADSHNLHAE